MPRTIAEALAATPLDPIDARALLCHVLEVGTAYLIAHAEVPLKSSQSERFGALVERRRAGEPLAYITGRREFFSLDFKVTPAVLIPRPETELLVEFALERLAPDSHARVLDLGTGSGCVAISIAKSRPRVGVVATDMSYAALALARENAQINGVTNLELIASDWFSAIAHGQFEMIVANPPYVAAGDPHLTQGDLRFEPKVALVGGPDGLECIRGIIGSAPRNLKSGGWLAFEHGYGQAEGCRDLLKAAGFTEVFSRADLAGIERVSGGSWRKQH